MTGNNQQLDLNFDAVGDLPANEAIEVPADATIPERFAAFHKKNGHVYIAIVSMARELKRNKFKQVGMKMIFEVLRWKYFLSTRGDKWKLNNNYTAHYSRLVMEQETDLADFFETREREH